jgi:hypothetical protein
MPQTPILILVPRLLLTLTSPEDFQEGVLFFRRRLKFSIRRRRCQVFFGFFFGLPEAVVEVRSSIGLESHEEHGIAHDSSQVVLHVVTTKVLEDVTKKAVTGAAEGHPRPPVVGPVVLGPLLKMK